MSSQHLSIQMKNERDYRIGISLINFDFDATGNLYRYIQKIGIKRVEISFDSAEKFFFLQESLMAHGISIQSIHARKDLFYQSSTLISTYLNELRKVSLIFPELFILFHPNGNNLKDYLEELANFPMKVCFENTIEDAAEILQILNFSNNFGLVLDIAHYSYHSSHVILADHPAIRYFHIRGFNNGYSTLLDNSDTAHKFTIKQLLENSKSIVVLENSYRSFQEIIFDYLYMRRL